MFRPLSSSLNLHLLLLLLQVLSRLVERRIKADCFTIGGEGLLFAIQRVQDDAPQVVRLGPVWGKLNGSFTFTQGLLEFIAAFIVIRLLKMSLGFVCRFRLEGMQSLGSDDLFQFPFCLDVRFLHNELVAVYWLCSFYLLLLLSVWHGENCLLQRGSQPSFRQKLRRQ